MKIIFDKYSKKYLNLENDFWIEKIKVILYIFNKKIFRL